MPPEPPAPPRPYPYPRPIPPPPIPHELADPLTCYKCHSPTVPLPLADSSESYSAESYYRQVLTSTWRTQIDSVEAFTLANELEAQGLLERWVEQLLEDGVDPASLSDKKTIEVHREGLKEAVRIVTSKELMETRMERVLKRVMESVLGRMTTLGYGTYCFHDLLRATPHHSVPTYTPTPPTSPSTADSFAFSVLKSIGTDRLPTFKARCKTDKLSPDQLTYLLVEAYPLWRNLLVECCKREHHKSMYDVQLMMVGGFSLKLLELGWRELRVGDAKNLKGRPPLALESEKRVGFTKVAKWCEAGGVRVALWDKGEKERMDKERTKNLAVWEAEEKARKVREDEEKKERKKRERTERRKKRDSDRLEEILGRLGAIEKERRALLEESLALEAERNTLESKLAPASPAPPSTATAPASPELNPVDLPSTNGDVPAMSTDPTHVDSTTPAPSTDPPATTTAPTPTPSSDEQAKAADAAVEKAEEALAVAEERLKIAQRIENVFQRMIDTPPSSTSGYLGNVKPKPKPVPAPSKEALAKVKAPQVVKVEVLKEEVKKEVGKVEEKKVALEKKVEEKKVEEKKVVEEAAPVVEEQKVEAAPALAPVRTPTPVVDTPARAPTPKVEPEPVVEPVAQPKVVVDEVASPPKPVEESTPSRVPSPAINNIAPSPASSFGSSSPPPLASPSLSSSSSSDSILSTSFVLGSSRDLLSPSHALEPFFNRGERIQAAAVKGKERASALTDMAVAATLSRPDLPPCTCDEIESRSASPAPIRARRPTAGRIAASAVGSRSESLDSVSSSSSLDVSPTALISANGHSNPTPSDANAVVLASSHPPAPAPKPAPLSYYPDPRLACPPIRCSGVTPNPSTLDALDTLLLDIFLLAHKIELADRRPLALATIRDTLIRQYILSPGWEKGDVDSSSQREVMEKLSRELLSSGYEKGTARADRGLESWLNATLLAVKSLPLGRGAGSRDCCICTLSNNLEHVKVVHSVLARRAELVVDDPETLTLPKPDLAGLLVYCRAQIKAGTLVARGGIWRSAPKWRFQVERLALAFEDEFEKVVRQFNYRQYEDDYPQIAKLVGGLSTFEAAHRLLLHPDPPEPGTTKRAPLAVEDVMGWAAFVSCNAPYEGDGNLSHYGDVKTIGLATAKVDEATKLFREAKYLEAIRAYSIAAIWACDRSGKDTPGAERKYLRDEARRTLKSGIYAQLSYLRTLFPSNRQWMSAVADATLAIACSQSNELPSALDLRSTALHGIRHYKLALSDLDDAALIDPVKGVDWLPRLLDMRRLVPESSRMRSKFAQRMALEGLPVPPPPPPPIAPVPKYSRKPRLELTASADEGKPNGKVVGRIEATKQSNGGIKPHGPPKELGPDDELMFVNVDPDVSTRATKDFVLCPDPRLACANHKCSPRVQQLSSSERNTVLVELDALLLRLFEIAHKLDKPTSRRGWFATFRDLWIRDFVFQPFVNDLMVAMPGETERHFLQRCIDSNLKAHFASLERPETRASQGWHYWLRTCVRIVSFLGKSPSAAVTAPSSSEPTICDLFNNLERVRSAVKQTETLVVDTRPSKMPTVDTNALISFCRAELSKGAGKGSTFWDSESRWTKEIPRLAEMYSASFDLVFADMQPLDHEDDFIKLARFVGGITTYEMSRRARRQVLLGSEEGAWVEDMSAFGAFVVEYAGDYLDEDELLHVSEARRHEMADEQDRKAQKSNGNELLAICAFSIKSIWLSRVQHPLRDDDSIRDDLFCTYAAMAKLRMRLGTPRQLEEAVADFTLALGYLNSATIRLNRAEALALIGDQDELAAQDVLEARRIGNFSGRLVPQWEISLAQRRKTAGSPQLAEVLSAATLEQLASDIVPIETSVVEHAGKPSRLPAKKLASRAESQPAPQVSTSAPASPSTNGVDKTVAPEPSDLAVSSSDAASTLPDPRLACPPDRHNLGAEPVSDSNTLDELDQVLLDIFYQIHAHQLHKLHPGRLGETRELFLQDFVRRRNGWEKTDVESSPAMRRMIRESIKIALGEMFTHSVLAGFGLEALVHALATMANTISEIFPFVPCVCTLTQALPALHMLLSSLREATAALPSMPNPPPTDVNALQAHCRAQIKTNGLSGGIWRSNPVWRKKTAALAVVFDEDFNYVVANDWSGAEAARRGEYEDVAKTVGGIAVWDKALRVAHEMELEGWRIEDDGAHGAGNGGREVEAVAGWMCFVGTGGAERPGSGAKHAGPLKEVEGETKEGKHRRWGKIKEERVRLGNIEVSHGEHRRALREFSVASLFGPDDPTVYVLMARSRLALNDVKQCHEVVADCTLGLARCASPLPRLPVDLSIRAASLELAPSPSLNTDTTSPTRADLLLLRAKALVLMERFGLALYDLEALSSSLRREQTAEADTLIKRIKTWIAQEQTSLECLRDGSHGHVHEHDHHEHDDGDDVCQCSCGEEHGESEDEEEEEEEVE